jgi:hypothetical protein
MSIKSAIYDMGCQPSPSISAETLLRYSNSTYLLFFAVSSSVNERGLLSDLGIAVLAVKNCVTLKMGYPNDEGLPEHQFYDYGLSKSPVLEIINSPWIKEVLEQKHASARRILSDYSAFKVSEEKKLKRHFIISFCENTFECIASSLIVECYCKTFEDAFTYVISKLNEN